MSGQIDARIALESRLNAIAGAISTQWENLAFVPVAGVPYQAVYVLFAQPDNPETSAGYIERGYMQVDLRYPVGVGHLPASTQALAIRNWFPRGLTLTANGLSVYIDRTPSISLGRIDDDRFVVTVKVTFHANNL